MMALRINSNLRGYSACSETAIHYIKECLNKSVLPIVPERGSISASGDLIPLSYIGGLIIGKKGVFAKVGENGEVLESEKALQKIGLEPFKL